MSETWARSFGFFFDSENGFHAWVSPDEKKTAFVEYSVKWDSELFGYKRLKVSDSEYRNLAILAGIDINTWRLVVVFHTHPFSRCFGVVCGPNAAYGDDFGPSPLDGGQTIKYPGAYHVVREPPDRFHDKYNRGSYVDYYYGPKAFSK
jgi:hypothetical protein